MSAILFQMMLQQTTDGSRENLNYYWYFSLYTACDIFWTQIESTSHVSDPVYVIEFAADNTLTLTNPLISLGVCGLAGAIAFGVATFRASRSLHAALLENVLRSPSLFFDVTPTGRITNRFSKDIDAIDTSLPQNFGGFLYCTYKVLGTMLVVGISTPWAVFAFVPLGVLNYLLQVHSAGNVVLTGLGVAQLKVTFVGAFQLV